jgi:hypothetical protein
MRRPFSFGLDERSDRLGQLAGRLRGRKVSDALMHLEPSLFWRSM